MTNQCVKHIAKTSNSKANNGSFIRKQLVEVRRLLDELELMKKKVLSTMHMSNKENMDYGIKLGKVYRILDELTKLQEVYPNSVIDKIGKIPRREEYEG